MNLNSYLMNRNLKVFLNILSAWFFLPIYFFRSGKNWIGFQFWWQNLLNWVFEICFCCFDLLILNVETYENIEFIISVGYLISKEIAKLQREYIFNTWEMQPHRKKHHQSSLAKHSLNSRNDLQQILVFDR